MTRKQWHMVIGVMLAVALEVLAIHSAFVSGYREGQYDCARKNIVYTIIEGQKVHFHGIDKQYGREPAEVK